MSIGDKWLLMVTITRARIASGRNTAATITPAVAINYVH